jgi:4-diphosphocytidyl-2-C-methyl-D-erythritol kinase
VIGTAPAKLNLALVVGPRRPDGKHELLTVYQRLALADELELTPAAETTITGFAEDSLVRRALASLDAPHGWEARIEKRIPVAGGLGGGSSDAATALRLGNAQLERPWAPDGLHELAAALGADVPFFLRSGPQIGSGDGTTLEPIAVPHGFAVLLLLPHGAGKRSTADVYADFDRRRGEHGFARRVVALRDALAVLRTPRDLAALPRNDLASSPLASELASRGAFRADVSGAGPVVYGLFGDRDEAARAAETLTALGRVWLTNPVP